MSELETLVRELARQVVREELSRVVPTWEWMPVGEAARLLGVTPKGVYSKCDRGVLTKHKFDGHVYVSKREVDAAIREATH